MSVVCIYAPMLPGFCRLLCLTWSQQQAGTGAGTDALNSQMEAFDAGVTKQGNAYAVAVK